MFSGLGGVRGTNFAKPRSGFGSTTSYSNNGDAFQPVYGRMPQGATLSNNGKGGYSMGGGGQGGVQGAGRQTGIDSLGRKVSTSGPQDGGPETWGTSSDYNPWGQQGSYPQSNNGIGSAAGATQVPGQQGYPTPFAGGPYSASNPNGWMTDSLFKDAEPVSGAEGGVSPQRGYAAVDENGQGVGGGFDWNSLNGSAPPPSMGPVNNSPAVQYQGGPVQTGVNYDFTQNPYNHSASGGSPQRNMSPVPGGNGPYMTDDEIRANDGRDVPLGFFSGSGPNNTGLPQDPNSTMRGQSGPASSGFWNGGQPPTSPPPSTDDPRAFRDWWQSQQRTGPGGYPINNFGGGNLNPWNNPQSDPRLRGGPFVRM